MSRIFILFLFISCNNSYSQSKVDLKQIGLNIWEMKPKGNVKFVTCSQKSSKNVAKEMRSKFTMTAYYDTNGRIIEYTNNSEMASKKSQNFLKEFHYNINNNISSITTNYILQKSIVRTEWNYDSINNKYVKTTFIPNNITKEIVSFSKDSNTTTTIIHQEKSDDIKIETFVNGNTKATNTFFADGKLMFKSTQVKTDSTINSTNLSYNKNGEIWQEAKSTSTPTLVKSESIIKYESGKKRKYVTTSKYNIYGDEIEILQEEYYDNSIKYTSSKYDYKYDTKGNYTYKACFVNELLMWEIKRTIEYY